MTGQKFGILAAAVLLFSSLVLSCSQDPNACVPGTPCVCKGQGVCDKYCNGKGCDFTCSEVQGDCKFRCEQGGCTVTAEDVQGSVVIYCEGGDCNLNFRGQGNASLTCEGNGCEMRCSGQGKCQLLGCNKNCSLTCSLMVSSCTNECDDTSCKVSRSGN